MLDRVWQIWAFINFFGYRTGLICFLTFFFQKHIKRPHYFLKNGYFTFGIRLRKKSSDLSIFRQVFLNQEYEFNLGFDPELLIDCGSNIGLTAIYFAKKYNNCRIICLEPDPENFSLLTENTCHYPNITCLNIGIWYKNAKLRIENSEAEKSAIRLIESDVSDPGNIQAKSIPELLSEFNTDTIDLLKIDIEGSEIELFTNNPGDWLARTKVLVIELHDRIRKGCSNAFINAIREFDVSLEIRGENILCNFYRNH